MESMTGFGAAEKKTPAGLLLLELQSVNRKHLDVSVILPKELSFFEMPLLQTLKRSFCRGQITARLYFAVTEEKVSTSWSIPLLLEMQKAWQKTAKALGYAEKDVSLSFLVKQLEESSIQVSYRGKLWENIVEELTKKAVIALNKTRKQEGKELEKDLKSRLQLIEKHLKALDVISPSIQKEMEQKMQERCQNFTYLPDHQEKIAREVAIYLDKMDVAEEITRLKHHLTEMRALIEMDKSLTGKEGTFIAQEMLREMRTILSKSSYLPVIQKVLAMQIEIERIKEQMQNVQ